jgi:hypothetical protein
MTIRSIQTFACVAAALAAATGLLASTGTAEARPGAGGCAPWVCGSNGTQLTGIRIDGNASSALAEAVTLPSGEIVRLRSDAGEQPRLQVARPGGTAGCAPWVCGENGTQITGIRIDGNASSAPAATVTLPSGEIVRLRSDAGEQPRLQVAKKRVGRKAEDYFDRVVGDTQVTPDEFQSLHSMSAGTTRRR